MAAFWDQNLHAVTISAQAEFGAFFKANGGERSSITGGAQSRGERGRCVRERPEGESERERDRDDLLIKGDYFLWLFLLHVNFVILLQFTFLRVFL